MVKAILVDDAKFKRSFHRVHINRMYLLNYVSVRPKAGKKLTEGCVRVVSLGSYYPSLWAKSWFKNYDNPHHQEGREIKRYENKRPLKKSNFRWMEA